MDAEAWPVTVKVYGDGTLMYYATISTSGNAYAVTGTSPTQFNAVDIPEPVLRLPATVANTFAIQIEAAKIVNEICIAESIDEIRGA